MSQWKKALLDTTRSVRDAIQVIDATGLQIAMVVDGDGRLLGTVTDGDIRRAILRGVSLDEPVAHVMNENPTTAREHDERETLLALMRRRRLHQVPLLDTSWRVVGLELLDDLIGASKERRNSVVLMAGGIGSRLRPLTDDCPKPLIRLGSKPILETILDTLVDNGFRRFFISVNYMADMIVDHFGDGGRWGVQIDYLRENQRLGTAGALSLLPERPDQPVLVMNGDLLTQLNFAHLLDFHADQGAAATMCVREYEMQVPYGVIETRSHQIVDIHEKPTQRYLVNAGIYVLQPETLEHIPAGQFFDMTDLFKTLLQQGMETAVFPIREYWRDIGEINELKKAGDYLGSVES